MNRIKGRYAIRYGFKFTTNLRENKIDSVLLIQGVIRTNQVLMKFPISC